MDVANQQCFYKTIDTQGIQTYWSFRTKYEFSQFLTQTKDRDQTVSQRSKPNSCTSLIGEQPNP